MLGATGRARSMEDDLHRERIKTPAGFQAPRRGAQSACIREVTLGSIQNAFIGWNLSRWRDYP
jgi:hypothetical protein